MQTYDLIIVGGGMTGIALAAGLADSGLSIALVEAADQPPHWQEDKLDIRVSALSEASRQLLEKVGAWQPMQALRVNPYQGMRVWDSEGTAEVVFDASEAGVLDLGYLVENSVTQLGLLAAVKDQQNLDWYLGEFSMGLSEPLDAGGRRELKLSSGKVLQAALIIGADGARSRLREWAGFKTREWDYNHHALVTSVRTERSHGNAAWQRFHSTGPLAFLPMNLQGDDHWCSIVWSTSPEKASELMELNEKDFNQQLTQAFEGRLGQVELSEERQIFPLRQRHAVEYIQPGLALIGDAAHTIHPLAGQGVNLGFMDVVALTEVLQQAADKKQALGSLGVLQKYQQRRRADNLAMMALMESFKRLYETQALPVLLLRNLGMKLVNSSTRIKRGMIARALGLKRVA